MAGQLTPLQDFFKLDNDCHDMATDPLSGDVILSMEGLATLDPAYERLAKDLTGSGGWSFSDALLTYDKGGPIAILDGVFVVCISDGAGGFRIDVHDASLG